MIYKVVYLKFENNKPEVQETFNFKSENIQIGGSLKDLLVSLEKTEKESKEESKEESEEKIKIYPEDTIKIVQQKIYAYTKIAPKSQYIFSENKCLTHEIPYIEDPLILYSLNILNIPKYLQNKNYRRYHDVPIDQNFISEYFEERSIFIKSLLTNQLQNLTKSNTIYVFNLNDFEITDDIDIYHGFVLKYFPQVSNIQNISDRKSPSYYINLFSEQERTLKTLQSISEKEIKTTFSETHKTQIIFVELRNKDLIVNLNLRTTFDFISTNKTLFYISFQYQNKMYYKINKQYYEESLTFFDKYIKNPINPNIIEFRIKNIVVQINNFGQISAKIYWKEFKTGSFKEIEESKKIINEYIIKKINIEKSEPNYYINIINVKINLNPIILKIKDYYKLEILSKIFEDFITIDKEKKIRTIKNPTSIYFRYLRSGLILNKGPSIKHQGGTNQLLQPISEYAKIGTDVYIVGQNNPRLFINNTRDFHEINNIRNFILRLLYIYKNIPTILKKPEFSNISDKWKRFNTLLEPKINNTKSKGSDIKKIKQLQQVDPKLFEFEKNNTKGSKFYSRLCQGKQQPIIIDDNQAKELENKGNEVLRYPNKTFEDQTVNYYCDHEIYKYPGFLNKRHPIKGFCLPCCFKSSSKKPKTRQYKNYLECTNTIKSENINLTGNNNVKYILEWNKTVPEGRFKRLPYELNLIFNSQNCNINKVNIIEKESECFIVPGVLDNNQNIFTAVALSLTPDSYKIAEFYQKNIDFIKKNKYIFNILENGKVKSFFNNINNFIDNYLSNENKFLHHEFLYDLLSKYNIYEPKGINIIIFNIGESTKLICNPSVDFSKKNVILLYHQEKNIYFPLFLIKVKKNKINIQRNFSEHDSIIKKIKDMKTELCNLTKLNEYGYPYANDFLEIDKNKYIITGQILNNNNNTIKYLEYNNQFTIPVHILSKVNKKIPIKNKVNFGTSKQIHDFIKDNSELNIYIKKDCLYESKVIGFILNQNYIVYINPEKYTKHNLPTLQFPNNYKDINLAVKSDNILEDKRTIEAKKEIYYHMIYNSIIYELSLKYNPKKNIEENIENITKQVDNIKYVKQSNFIETFKGKVPVYSKMYPKLVSRIKNEFTYNDIFRNSIINQTISVIKDLSIFSHNNNEILISDTI